MQFLPIPLPRGRQMLGIALNLAVFGVAASAGFAQTPALKTYDAPPEIVSKLRARVDEFFKFHTNGSINYRKAFTMVAEDTQDYYFAVQKANYISVRILTIQFTNPEFTRATVDLEGMQKIQRVEFAGGIIPLPMTTLWKVEDGEWKWYRDANDPHLTPMGPSDLATIRAGDKVSKEQLEQLGDPKVLEQMGKNILAQTSIDKGDVNMPLDKPSSVDIKFHNAQPGEVKLEWKERFHIEGFTISVDKVDVPAHEDAILRLNYDPPADRLKTGQESTQRIMLVVQPFNQSFPIIVRFQ
jgi:hypothetical protein